MSEESFGAAATRQRREWLAGQLDAAPQAPWPPPEVACRRAEVSEVPRGARAVQRVAEGAEWAVTATYARGTSRPGRVVDSLALRMRRGDRRAVGVWMDGAFDTAFMWGADLPCVMINATELRAALVIGDVGELIATVRARKLRASEKRVTVGGKAKTTSRKGRVHA